MEAVERVLAILVELGLVEEGATQEEEEMVEEGFEVTEPYQLGDRSAVKEDRVVLPPAKHVLIRIERSSTRLGRPVEAGNPASGSVRSLNLQVRLPEGIDVVGEDGEAAKKYVNKVDFLDLEYQVVNPEARQEERYTGKNQAFLFPLTQFLSAVGYPPTEPVTIDDEFLTSLIGKTLYVDVGKRGVNTLDPTTGKWVQTGEFRNTWRNFQSA